MFFWAILQINRYGKHVAAAVAVNPITVDVPIELEQVAIYNLCGCVVHEVILLSLER